MNRHVSLSRIKHESAPSGNRVAWKPENVTWRHNRRGHWLEIRYTAIPKKVARKNLHAAISKGTMGYDQYTFPGTVDVDPTFLAFF